MITNANFPYKFDIKDKHHIPSLKSHFKEMKNLEHEDIDNKIFKTYNFKDLVKYNSNY